MVVLKDFLLAMEDGCMLFSYEIFIWPPPQSDRRNFQGNLFVNKAIVWRDVSAIAPFYWNQRSSVSLRFNCGNIKSVIMFVVNCNDVFLIFFKNNGPITPPAHKLQQKLLLLDVASFHEYGGYVDPQMLQFCLFTYPAAEQRDVAVNVCKMWH